MRIQLSQENKKTDYRTWLPDPRARRYVVLAHPTAGYYNDYYVIFFCKDCGTEFFGEWSIPIFGIQSDIWHRFDEKAKTLLLKNDFNGFNRHLEDCHKEDDSIYIDGPCTREQFDKMHGVFQAMQEETITRTKQAMEMFNITHCPKCGKVLSRDRGYFAAKVPSEEKHINLKKGIKEGIIDQLSDSMQNFRLSKEKDAVIQKLETMLAKYESTAPTGLVPGGNVIKEQAEALKKYVLSIVQTETNIFSLTKRLTELYEQRIEVDRNAFGSTKLPLLNANERVKKAQDTLENCRKKFDQLIRQKIIIPDIPMPQYPQKPTEPIYGQPGFFNKKRILAQNEMLKSEYEQACRKYENEMVRYDQELENRRKRLVELEQKEEQRHQAAVESAKAEIEKAENNLVAAKKERIDIENTSADMATPEKAHKAILDNEIQQAEELLEKAIHCKHQLYNCNVIFGKYRNFVAMSTIYEYLVSGRCTSLEGTNGAYNLYESETRANIIIAQLNHVLESLETIKENQYMIYDAIQNVDASLYRLNATMSAVEKSLSSIDAKAQTMTKYMARIADNSDVIAHNTAVTAHYSKINAELTNALGYMVAFR